MNEDRKVPLNVGRLSEEGMLVQAAGLLGYAVVARSATDEGIELYGPDGKIGVVKWDDNLLFTAAQLLDLGYELGDVLASAIRRLLTDRPDVMSAPQIMQAVMHQLYPGVKATFHFGTGAVTWGVCNKDTGFASRRCVLAEGHTGKCDWKER